MASLNNYFTPSQIVTENYTLESNLASAYARWLESESGFGVDGEVKMGRRSVLLKLKGTVNWPGIVCKEWSMPDKKNGGIKSGKYYTLTIVLDDEIDENAFGFLTNALETYCDNNVSGSDISWNVINPLKNGKIALKMKFTGNRFDARFNSMRIPVNQLDAVNELFDTDLPIIVLCELTTTFGFEELKANYNMVVKKLIFDGDIDLTKADPTPPKFEAAPQKRVTKKTVEKVSTSA